MAEDIDHSDMCGIYSNRAPKCTCGVHALYDEVGDLKNALSLMLAWHDEVRRQTPIIPSPFGIEKARAALGVNQP